MFVSNCMCFLQVQRIEGVKLLLCFSFIFCLTMCCLGLMADHLQQELADPPHRCDRGLLALLGPAALVSYLFGFMIPFSIVVVVVALRLHAYFAGGAQPIFGRHCCRSTWFSTTWNPWECRSSSRRRWYFEMYLLKLFHDKT